MYTKKAIPFLLLRILETYSDDNHKLTQSDIIDYMKKDYNLEVERKSISANLKLLEDLDYDIIRDSKGVSIGDRVFNHTQVRYLIDAVYSSKNITSANAQELIKKLSERESIYEKKTYDEIVKTTNEVNRNQNAYIFQIIDVINEAKRLKKRISFNLITYDEYGNKILKQDGYEPHVTPYFLINNFGNYYLLGNYRSKYHPFNIYKLDRMANVCVSDWEEKPMKEAGMPDNFKISDYLNEHIYILSDDVIDADLLLKSSEEIINVKEWFPTSKIKNIDGKIHAYIRCDEQALLYWVMQYGIGVVVLSPESLKKKVIDYIDEMKKNYEE